MKILVSSFSFKVFINDLDNNIKLINDFVDKGNMFIIASGKNISNIRKIIGNRELKCSYYICNDGASIFDQFMNIIYRVDIEKEYVKPIYNALIDNPTIGDVKIDISTAFVDDYQRATNKIVANYSDYDKALKIANALNYKFNNLNAYLSGKYVNITSKKISKGYSLDYLLNFYNLKDNEVFTISKDENDLSLKDYESFIIDKDLKDFKYRANSFKEAIEKIENF